MVVFAIAFVLLLWKAPGLDFYLGSADHGYQLSIMRQILLGEFPYIDVFFYYGPMFGFTSALGALATGNLVGETVICAVGYAAALTLIYVLVARNSFSGRRVASCDIPARALSVSLIQLHPSCFHRGQVCNPCPSEGKSGSASTVNVIDLSGLVNPAACVGARCPVCPTSTPDTARTFLLF